MTAAVSPRLPGRLGSPGMRLQDDPRADPRMIAAMAPLGMAGASAPLPVEATSPREAQLAYCTMAEAGFGAAFETFKAGLPPVAGVTSTTEVIKGDDGNDITLFIHRPTRAGGPLPGVLHLHGGGMVILEAASGVYQRLRDELAGAGMVVVGVEFRNGGGKHGPHPFPAGLNDCASALRWMSDNATRLGISKLIVSGESGGGNLTLATAIKANREGQIHRIDGVYALCPYISNGYGDRPAELASLFENDDYLLSCAQMAVMAQVYDPTGANAANPLAWPLFAGPDDLAGLPPHVISVNELDPLRDEGIAYHRKLIAAGVSSICRTINGTCHAGDVLFPAVMPDLLAATVRDIKGFADSL